MHPTNKISASDRYMPCLLSRLCDQDPGAATERYVRGVSIKEVRQDILMNIGLVLNSRSRPSSRELEDDETIVSSVLGMGLGDFCGCSRSEDRRRSLQEEVSRQVRLFEPRLAPESVEVRILSPMAGTVSTLDMEIRGRICIAEMEEEQVFRSLLELESGAVTVELKDARE